MDLINEDYIDNIITNLKVISLIQVNDKLNIRKGHLQIDKESNMRSIYSWLIWDSRDIVLKYIKDILRNIYLTVNKIKTTLKNKESIEEHVWILTRIYSEFETVELGLNNLKVTYSDDTVVTVTIDNIIIKLKELFLQIKNIIK